MNVDYDGNSERGRYQLSRAAHSVGPTCHILCSCNWTGIFFRG